MTEITMRSVVISPRTPITLRDARPFAAEPGAHAFTLPWPYPRTIAGAVRTHAGEHRNVDWDTANGRREVLGIPVHGALMVAREQPKEPWTVYVPAPRDVIFLQPKEGESTPGVLILRPRPVAGDEGCDWTSTARSGVVALAHVDLRPMEVGDEGKALRGAPQWWAINDGVRWLNTSIPDRHVLPVDDAGYPNRGLSSLGQTTRTHVGIDPATSAHRDGALFTTDALLMPGIPTPQGYPAVAMLARVGLPADHHLPDGSIDIGGEGGFARIRVLPHDVIPEAVIPDSETLRNMTGLRLQLVTPGLFTHGWLPGWLADGTIPGFGKLGLSLKLVGAAIDRRVAISGWKYDTGRKGTPRATRFAVPAGGVYFFTFNRKPEPEVLAEIWRRLWLTPISDRQIDRNDGYGLVLPGLWSDSAPRP